MNYYLMNAENSDEKILLLDEKKWSEMAENSGGKVEAGKFDTYLIVDDFKKWEAIYKSSQPHGGDLGGQVISIILIAIITIIVVCLIF